MTTDKKTPTQKPEIQTNQDQGTTKDVSLEHIKNENFISVMAQPRRTSEPSSSGDKPQEK